MKVTELLNRKHWEIKTINGGVVSITHRENDFFIKHGDMISQCPLQWFVIGGNLDEFNERSSKNNQSCITLGMMNPQTEMSLLSICIDTDELEAIKSDSVLSKYLNIGILDKIDCLS